MDHYGDFTDSQQPPRMRSVFLALESGGGEPPPRFRFDVCAWFWKIKGYGPREVQKIRVLRL